MQGFIGGNAFSTAFESFCRLFVEELDPNYKSMRPVVCGLVQTELDQVRFTY